MPYLALSCSFLVPKDYMLDCPALMSFFGYITLSAGKQNLNLFPLFLVKLNLG
jgi:hypothetical protein